MTWILINTESYLTSDQNWQYRTITWNLQVFTNMQKQYQYLITVSLHLSLLCRNTPCFLYQNNNILLAHLFLIIKNYPTKQTAMTETYVTSHSLRGQPIKHVLEWRDRKESFTKHTIISTIWKEIFFWTAVKQTVTWINKNTNNWGLIIPEYPVQYQQDIEVFSQL